MTELVDGEPWAVSEAAVPDTTPVTMINAYSVPLEQSDRFLRMWRGSSARIMSEQPGFVRAVMHKTIAGDELTFVDVAEWRSADALRTARANSEWRAAITTMLDDPELHVRARPGRYQVVDYVRPAGE
ncbi:antibiotic biosynthesis monooxygenase family protein [Nocardia heshunensis]